MDDELRKQLRHILGQCCYVPKGQLCPHEIANNDMTSEDEAELDAIMQLIKQDRERTKLYAQFELCRDLINKNHDGVQINWSALGGDVANMKVSLAQQLTPTNSEADHA